MTIGPIRQLGQFIARYPARTLIPLSLGVQAARVWVQAYSYKKVGFDEKARKALNSREIANAVISSITWFGSLYGLLKGLTKFKVPLTDEGKLLLSGLVSNIIDASLRAPLLAWLSIKVFKKLPVQAPAKAPKVAMLKKQAVFG